MIRELIHCSNCFVQMTLMQTYTLLIQAFTDTTDTISDSNISASSNSSEYTIPRYSVRDNLVSVEKVWSSETQYSHNRGNCVQFPSGINASGYFTPPLTHSRDYLSPSGPFSYQTGDNINRQIVETPVKRTEPMSFGDTDKKTKSTKFEA